MGRRIRVALAGILGAALLGPAASLATPTRHHRPRRTTAAAGAVDLPRRFDLGPGLSEMLAALGTAGCGAAAAGRSAPGQPVRLHGSVRAVPGATAGVTVPSVGAAAAVSAVRLGRMGLRLLSRPAGMGAATGGLLRTAELVRQLN